MLLEEIIGIIDVAGLDSGVEFCDESLQVLRSRLDSAVRAPKPADLRRAFEG
jgi:hypothetical protein